MTIPVLVEGQRIARPHGGASSRRSSRCEGGDTAYRIWLGHTRCCPTCRAGIACSAAVHLGRAWREARRG
jgi:hypothetical protein